MKKIFTKKKMLKKISKISKSTICMMLIFPVIAGVMVACITNSFGSVKLKNIRILPYYAANSETVTANEETGENVNNGNDGEIVDNYMKACTVETLMFCNKPFGTYLNGITVQVSSIEKYKFSKVSYFAYVEGERVRVYAINYGNGIFESGEVILYVEKMGGERKDIAQDYSWRKVEASGETLYENNSKGATVHIDDLYGGDGKMIYSFQLNDEILGDLETGNYFGLYIDDPYSTNGERYWLGWITMENGQALINGGGGAGETDITAPAYIDVEKGANQKIQTTASGAITGYSTVDLVLIPSESCIVEYSLQFDIEGKMYETEKYKTTFEVPLYEPNFVYMIAEYMDEKHIEDYIYQKTNWNLSQKVEYIPKETMNYML